MQMLTERSNFTDKTLIWLVAEVMLREPKLN